MTFGPHELTLRKADGTYVRSRHHSRKVAQRHAQASRHEIVSLVNRDAKNDFVAAAVVRALPLNVTIRQRH